MSGANLEIVDPTAHPDWDECLLRGGDEDFFHTAAWGRVLGQSYGYRPLHFVMREKAAVAFCMPFMAVSSPWTGSRGISLPFTDRCAPFFREAGHLSEAVNEVKEYGRTHGWKYVEWRDSAYFHGGEAASESFLTHDVSFEGSLPKLYGHLDDGNRRNIRKAERENVTIEIGRSAGAVESFYRLHCLTRKRHGLPPQPLSFFRNVLAYVLTPGLGLIVLARHGGEDIAAAVFFHFGRTAIYKFGASDPRQWHLRPNNLVMWKAIQWFGERGFSRLTLGRTETDNTGLLRFKRGWNARESGLGYFRFDLERNAHVPAHHRVAAMPRALLARMPAPVLRLIGEMAYKHMG